MYTCLHWKATTPPSPKKKNKPKKTNEYYLGSDFSDNPKNLINLPFEIVEVTCTINMNPVLVHVQSLYTWKLQNKQVNLTLRILSFSEINEMVSDVIKGDIDSYVNISMSMSI